MLTFVTCSLPIQWLCNKLQKVTIRIKITNWGHRVQHCSFTPDWKCLLGKKKACLHLKEKYSCNLCLIITLWAMLLELPVWYRIHNISRPDYSLLCRHCFQSSRKFQQVIRTWLWSKWSTHPTTQNEPMIVPSFLCSLICLGGQVNTRNKIIWS